MLIVDNLTRWFQRRDKRHYVTIQLYDCSQNELSINVAVDGSSIHKKIT